MTAPAFTMTARFVGLRPNAIGRGGLARLVLSYRWDHALPVAAWLMNNPSLAGQPLGGLVLEPSEKTEVETAATFDPTAKRVVHFSKALGAGGADLVNWCPIVETYPAELWRMLKEGHFLAALEAENHAAIALAAAAAKFCIVATGNEGLKRAPTAFRNAFMVFQGPDRLLALGTSGGGAPLHPLARGKHAITNDRVPVPFVSDWPFGPGDV